MNTVRTTADIQTDTEWWDQVESHTFGIIESLMRAQGITNDGCDRFWFSCANALLRTDSALGKAVKTNLYPFSRELKGLGANHIGDIDYANGKIFAPIEDGPGYKHPVIGIFNADSLKLERFAGLPRDQQRDGVPWVAVDAARDCVYSSQYKDAKSINVYSMSSLQLLRQITMSCTVDAIQGAKVHNGNLYMTANAMKDNTSIKDKYAIYKMDLGTGEIGVVAEFQDQLNEVEGMTFVPGSTGYELYVLAQIGKLLNIRMVLYIFRLRTQ